MIRFVDLRDAQIPGVRFGYWDTITDRWVEINGDQAWSVFCEIEETSAGPDTIGRLRAVTPPWAKTAYGMVDDDHAPDDS